MRTAIHPKNTDFHNLVGHFLALSARERLVRFGRVLCAVDIAFYVDSILETPENALIVLEPAQDVAGVAHLDLQDRVAELGLTVSSWARGQGIGTLLLEQAADLAAARGVSTLLVRGQDGNLAARKLARRIGMTPTPVTGDRSAQFAISLESAHRRTQAGAQSHLSRMS